MENKFGISTDPFNKPSTTTGAEGVYQGTTSTSFAIFSVVLDNGEWWGLYGGLGIAGLVPTGLIQASGTSNNGSFTSSTLHNFGNAGTTNATGSVSASYTAESNFSGTVTQTLNTATQTFTFTGTSPITAGTYNYDQAASLSDITGTWTTVHLSGATYLVNVQQSGAFTATSVSCTLTGTFTPRASGKNVFDVALTVGAAPCASPGAIETGVALTYVLKSGSRQLLLAATDSAKTAVTELSGAR
jgi:hypothetical protein